MKGFHIIDVYGKKTNQVRRDKAVPMTIRRDGYEVTLPAICFNKNSGRMKVGVLKDVVGKFTNERVARLMEKYGATVKILKEEKGA